MPTREDRREFASPYYVDENAVIISEHGPTENDRDAERIVENRA